MNTTRRSFLKASTLAGAAVGFPTIIPSTVLGQNGSVAPSNRVNVGVLACGGRSGAAGAYTHYDKAQIVAVCDPILARRKQRAAQWEVNDDYADFREVLARDDVDAVHISTGDYWHVPMSLAAAQAGKDVYCEKPLGISIEQNLAARRIVSKYNRVFQYGTQQRSSDACRMGLEVVLNGHIGDVKDVYVWAPRGAQGGNPGPEVPVPDGVDYEMWLGPAPVRPYTHDRCHKNGSIWHNYDYAIGFIAGWGAHPLDILQWWADELDLGIPVEYSTTGAVDEKAFYNAVSLWQMEATYASGLKMHFLDNQSAMQEGSVVPFDITGPIKHSNCTLFMGSKGWVSVSRGNFLASSEAIRRKAKDPGPVRLKKSHNHFGNFIDSVISREQPIAGVESACSSDIISQMGDICIRTGETVRWDPEKETVVGSSDAVVMMHRDMRKPWSL